MNFESILNDFSELLIKFKENLMAIIPNLVFAIIIILLGFGIARLFQKLIIRFLQNLDRFIPGKKLQNGFKRIRMEGSTKLVGKIVYWIIIIFFLTAATEVLGLPIITTWLGGLVRYLPNILIAIIIVSLGLIGGKLLGDLLISTSVAAGLMYSNILGRIVQYTIVLITILIAVNQLGIDISILIGIIDIILAALLFGAALAFGLGARTSVSNILASYYLQGRYREDQVIKIGNTEGRIVQFTSTQVILETSEGQVSIPAKKFNEDTSILITKEE